MAKQEAFRPIFESNPMLVVTLYAAMPSEKQRQAFEEFPKGRKVILATNIAETAVTFKSVKYVVDCGLAKIKLYDAMRGIESLALLPISKSSADQRAGRAGRTSPGKCFRLYTPQSYNDMQQFNTPVSSTGDNALGPAARGPVPQEDRLSQPRDLQAP